MSDPMNKLLVALLSLTKALNTQSKAINALAESNERLADSVLAGEPEQSEDEGHGVDMAGNRVVPS